MPEAPVVAVTAAMMATLATTAAPRFAGVGDTAKANQTRQNLDRIASIVNQFYMDKSASKSPTNGAAEGQGRAPGQPRFDQPVGGYSTLFEIKDDLKTGGFDFAAFCVCLRVRFRCVHAFWLPCVFVAFSACCICCFAIVYQVGHYQSSDKDQGPSGCVPKKCDMP